MTDKKESNPKKSVPTILPSGFGIRINSQKLIMLEFVDLDYDKNATVIGSYALDEKMLEDLKIAINNTLGKIKKWVY